MASPSVSVIIPTKGRLEPVLETLDSFLNQTYVNFDVWLIDQNEDHRFGVPYTNASTSPLAKHFNLLRLHHERTPPLGSHGARNWAIERTAAELCLFVDDDVEVKTDFIENHVNAHRNYTEATVVVGRVIQPKDGMSEVEMQRRGKLARYYSNIGLVTGNFVGTESGPIDHIHECNFSAKTTALRAVGGFNTSFQGNAYFEGADLGLRLIRAGFSLQYDPRISLIHHQAPSGGNRVVDRRDHTYWFMHNYALLNGYHARPWAWLFFVPYCLGYLTLKAAKNADLNFALRGITGLVVGIKYFCLIKKKVS